MSSPLKSLGLGFITTFSSCIRETNILYLHILGTGSRPIWLSGCEYSEEDAVFEIRCIFLNSTMGHIFNTRCAQHSHKEPWLERMCIPRWSELAQDEAILLQQLHHRVSWELHHWHMWMHSILLPQQWYHWVQLVVPLAAQSTFHSESLSQYST